MLKVQSDIQIVRNVFQSSCRRGLLPEPIDISSLFPCWLHPVGWWVGSMVCGSTGRSRCPREIIAVFGCVNASSRKCALYQSLRVLLGVGGCHVKPSRGQRDPRNLPASAGPGSLSLPVLQPFACLHGSVALARRTCIDLPDKGTDHRPPRLASRHCHRLVPILSEVILPWRVPVRLRHARHTDLKNARACVKKTNVLLCHHHPRLLDALVIKS